MEEEIKDKIRKLPVEKVEKVKEVLKEIKRLKEEGKNEFDDEVLSRYMEFRGLLK